MQLGKNSRKNKNPEIASSDGVPSADNPIDSSDGILYTIGRKVN